jgi:DNA-binding transcriptional ArsR family regulator
MRKSRNQGASEQDLEQMVNVFKLLSDRTRLTILLLLSQGERNVTSLCEELNLPQPTVSHHLGLLRMSKLIDNRRNGKQVFYSLGENNRLTDSEELELGTDRYAVRIGATSD